MGLIGDALSWLGNTLWDGIKWVGQLIANLFQGVIDLLVLFFEVIFALISGLFYFIYKIGVLAVLLFQVFLEIGKLIWSLLVGFARTLGSLFYTPRTTSGTGYSEIMGRLFDNLAFLQIDVIAYILLFVLWWFTAIQSLKLISSIRVGGE